MKYYTMHEFSQLVGKTPQTLRNWDKSGVLKPHHFFACRLQGKRANLAKKFIKELKEYD